MREPLAWVADPPAVAAWCCAVALLASTPCGAQESAAPFSGRYKGQASFMGIKATARAELQLRRSSKYLLYTMDSTVKVPLYERRFKECSVLAVDAERMTPLEYAHTDVSDPGANVRTVFDWQRNLASTTLGKAAATTQAIAWPTWDPMSYQVALMALASRRKPGDAEVQRVIERGRAKEHNVRFNGAVAAAGVPAGLKVHEVVSRKSSGRVVLHLMPQSSWQPWRITIDDIAIERDGVVAGAVPLPLPEGTVPTCAAAPP